MTKKQKAAVYDVMILKFFILSFFYTWIRHFIAKIGTVLYIQLYF